MNKYVSNSELKYSSLIKLFPKNDTAHDRTSTPINISHSVKDNFNFTFNKLIEES